MNQFFGLKYLKFFDEDADADPGSGTGRAWIRHPGWKKFISRMEKIRIRDKHPGYATLIQFHTKTIPYENKNKTLLPVHHDHVSVLDSVVFQGLHVVC
jgi:hypothetical protein